MKTTSDILDKANSWLRLKTFLKTRIQHLLLSETRQTVDFKQLDFSPSPFLPSPSPFCLPASSLPFPAQISQWPFALVTNKRMVPFYNSCPAKPGHCRTARRYQTLRNILHSGRRLSSVPPSLSARKFCHPPPPGVHLFLLEKSKVVVDG